MSVGGLGGSDVNNAISSGMQAVAGGIAAAEEQGGPSLDDAIQFFSWVGTDATGTVTPEWFVRGHEAIVEIEGHTDNPADFFSRAATVEETKINEFSSLVSMDSVLAQLRTFGFDFSDGLSGFLETGMLDALQSLKPQALSPEAEAIPVPLTLDELLPPDRLKEADPAMVQRSVHTMFEMFDTLKNIVDASTNIRLNLLRNLRG